MSNGEQLVRRRSGGYRFALTRLFSVLLLVSLSGCWQFPQSLKWRNGAAVPLVQASECPALQPSAPPAAAPLPEQFSVLVWNIYKQQRAGFQAALSDWSQQSDLLLLQEAVLPQTPALGIALGQWHWQQPLAFRWNGDSAGVMTLSRYAASASCAHTLAEPWIRFPKSILAQQYPLHDGRELLAINVHAINFTLGIEAYQAQLEPFVTLMRQHDGPIILAGDFNTWSDARLRWLEQVVRELGMEEALPQPDRRRRMLGLPLDHLYFRGLELIGSRSEASTASDHNPLWAVFRLRPKLR